MKLLTMLTLLSFYANVNASDEKICEYLKTNTFKNFSDSFNTSDGNNIDKLRSDVSRDLDLQRQEQCKAGNLWAVRDYDSCSILCISYGSSETRIKATQYTKGAIDLTKETRKCQQLCKSYQVAAFAFEAGIKASRNVKESASPDCRGVVDTSGRANKKATIFDGALEKERDFDSKVLAK